MMKRTLRELLSFEALKHLVHVPAIILRFRNWYPFLMNYVGLRHTAETYELRSGVKISTSESIDTATIAVIFIKKDYGSVNDNAVVVDIGANIGVYSVYAAARARNVKVFAYEPMKSCYDLLVKNIKANRLNVKTFNEGVSCKKGQRKLYLGDTSPYNSMFSKTSRSVTISCITLQQAIKDLEHVDILKVDCEGAEYEIFYNSSKATLAKIREIRMEYHNLDKKKNNVRALRLFLENNGFHITRHRRDFASSGVLFAKKVK